MTLRFQAGGTLGEDALYVRRGADDELPEVLGRGQFCHVLAPRQMGKSSLRTRAARTLERGGNRLATIDLCTIGVAGGIDDEGLYFGVLQEIADQLGLADPEPFWRRHGLLGGAHRMLRYVRDVVLEAIAGKVVVFVDEIDALATLPAPRRAAFFGAVRSAWNARATDPTWQRLTFCMLGAATPQDLMDDAVGAALLGVGRDIALGDFTRSELDGLLPGLDGLGIDPRRLLDDVFDFTGGHPYMSQRVCQEALRAPGGSIPALVERLFLRGRAPDPNLAEAERWFSRQRPDARVAPMLQLYGRLRAGERVPAQSHDPIQLALRMTGMAAERSEEGRTVLVVRNRSFESTFDLGWVRARMGERLLGEPLARWQEASERDDLLLRGEALREALAWAQGREDLTVDENRFLRAGLERARAAERRRRRWAQLVGVALLVASMALLWSWRRARENQRRAEALNQVETGLHASSLARRTGKEIDALVAGVRAVAPSLRDHTPPPEQVVRGLNEAVHSARRSLVIRTTGVVRTMAFSPDGRRIAFGAIDGTAALRDATNGHLVSQLPGHRGEVSAVVFSPDGKRLLTTGSDGVARLHDGSSGQPLWTIRSTLPMLGVAAFSPNGAQIAVGGWGNHQAPAVQILSAADGQVLQTMRGHAFYLMAVAFTLDGRRVVTASPDHTARLYDASTGALIAELRGHDEGLTHLRISPDGASILTTALDGTARLWDALTGSPRQVIKRPRGYLAASFAPGGEVITADIEGVITVYAPPATEPRLQLAGPPGGTVVVAAFPDGMRAITALHDGTAAIWSTRTGQVLATLGGHTRQITTVAVSADGARIATAAHDRSVRLWSGRTGLHRPILQGHRQTLTTARFAPDGRAVMTAGADGTVRLWDGLTGQPIHVLRGHGGYVSKGVFTPDGARLVTVGDDHSVRLWDARAGRLLATVAHPESPVDAPSMSHGHIACVPAADGHVLLIDARTGDLRRVLPGHHPRCTNACAFSPDGAKIVTVGDDGVVALWDAASGQPLRRMSGHQGSVGAAWFAPGGDVVATAGDDRTSRVFSVDSGATIAVLQGHEDEVWFVRFSSDGRRLITGSKDGTVRVWDRDGYRLAAVLRGHTAKLADLALSRDGNRLVTASFDGTARIWDLASGQLLAVLLRDHYEPLVGVDISPDGTRVVTASWDYTARLWDARTGRLLRPPPDDDLLVSVTPELTEESDDEPVATALARACRLLEDHPEHAQVRDICPSTSR